MYVFTLIKLLRIKSNCFCAIITPKILSNSIKKMYTINMTSDRFPRMTSSVIIRSAVETRAAYTNCDTIKSNYCSQRPPAADKTEYRYSAGENNGSSRAKKFMNRQIVSPSSLTFPSFYKRRANF